MHKTPSIMEMFSGDRSTLAAKPPLTVPVVEDDPTQETVENVVPN
jgi:hypothetical protein